MSRYTPPAGSRVKEEIIVLDSSPEPDKHDPPSHPPSEPVDVKPVLTTAQTVHPDSSSSPIIELPHSKKRPRITVGVARKTTPKEPIPDSELEFGLERSPSAEQEIRYEPLRGKSRITVARKTAPKPRTPEWYLKAFSPEPESRPAQGSLHLLSRVARKSAPKMPEPEAEETSDTEPNRTASYDMYIMASPDQDDASGELMTGKTEIGDSEAESSFNAEVSPHAAQPAPNADTMIEASWGFSHLDGMQDIQQTVTLDGIVPSKRKAMSIGALLAPQPEANVDETTVSNISATSSGSPPSKRLRTYISPSDSSDKAQPTEFADSTATSFMDASRSLDRSVTTLTDEEQDHHLPDASDFNTKIYSSKSLGRVRTPEPSADPPEPASSSPLSEIDPSFSPTAPPVVQGPRLRRRVQPTSVPKPRPQPIRIQPSRIKAPSTAPHNTFVHPPPPRPKRTQAPRTNLASSQIHNTLSQQTLPSASTSYDPDSDIDAVDSGDDDVPAHGGPLTASLSTLRKTRRELARVKQHFQEACRDWERRSGKFKEEVSAAEGEARKFKDKYFNDLNDLVEKKVEKATKQLTQEFQSQLEGKKNSRAEKKRSGNGRGKKSRTEVDEVYREANVAIGRLLQVDPSFADRIAGFDPEVEAALREAVGRRNGQPPAELSRGMELAQAGRRLMASGKAGNASTQTLHGVAASVMWTLVDDLRSTIDNMRTTTGPGGVAGVQKAARKKLQANLEAAETALAEGFATASSSTPGAPLHTLSGIPSPSIPPFASRPPSMQRNTPAATPSGDAPLSSPTNNAIATVAEIWQSEASGKFTKALQATVRNLRETNRDLTKKLEEEVRERRGVERKLKEEGKAREELEGKMAEMQEKFGEMQAKLAELQTEDKAGQGGGGGTEGQEWGWGL